MKKILHINNVCRYVFLVLICPTKYTVFKTQDGFVDRKAGFYGPSRKGGQPELIVASSTRVEAQHRQTSLGQRSRCLARGCVVGPVALDSVEASSRSGMNGVRQRAIVP